MEQYFVQPVSKNILDPIKTKQINIYINKNKNNLQISYYIQKEKENQFLNLS